MSKNRLSYLLGLIFILMFLLVSCANTDNETNHSGNESETVEESISMTDDSALFEAELPELDFDGALFRIINPLSSGSWDPTINVDELNADVLNDAIYTRSRLIEEQFNILFSEVKDSSCTTIFKNSIYAGDDQWELATMPSRDGLTFATEGLCLPIADLPYIDTDKYYWSQTLNRDMTIRGNLYFSFGDFNMTSYEATVTLLFNKSVLEKYSHSTFGDPYELVNSGKWTFDKMRSMMIEVTTDLNGDGVLNSEDQYGFTAPAKEVLPSFWIAANVRSINKNENDEPVLTILNDEKFISVFEKIMETMHSDNVWVSYDAKNDIFASDRALFEYASFKDIRALRDMTSDFGIIPYPKWDTNQERYLTRVFGGGVSVVPVTVKDPVFVSVIMEALACESRKTVIPAYYEIALKSKYARDDESARMLDMMFDNRVFDLGDTYWNNYIRDGIFAGMFSADNRELISTFTKEEERLNGIIEAVIEAFEKIDSK